MTIDPARIHLLAQPKLGEGAAYREVPRSVADQARRQQVHSILLTPKSKSGSPEPWVHGVAQHSWGEFESFADMAVDSEEKRRMKEVDPMGSWHIQK